MTQMLPDPLGYAGGYSLDLYCDHDHSDDFGNSLGTFYGQTFPECARDARAVGWIIHKATRTATCPRCSGKKK